jgi:hypothetical protein
MQAEYWSIGKDICTFGMTRHSSFGSEIASPSSTAMGSDWAAWRFKRGIMVNGCESSGERKNQLRVRRTRLKQERRHMNDDTDKKTEAPAPKLRAVTSYPGKNDGRISASKNVGMRPGASRPGPKKK